MALFDAFTFFNELDLLEIRLNEHSGFVDWFVLVEGRQTFTGREKQLWFEDNKARYANFLDRIIHIVVDDFPTAKSAWDREYFQRRAIGRGLLTAEPTDFVIISDVDEILRAEVVNGIKTAESSRNALTIFGLREYHHRLNLQRDGFTWWAGPRMLERRLMRDAQRVRSLKAFPSKTPIVQPILPLMRAAQSFSVTGRLLTYNLVSDAGWHFSSMGGAAQVAEKIRSYSHQEYNTAALVSETRHRDDNQAGQGAPHARRADAHRRSFRTAAPCRKSARTLRSAFVVMYEGP